MRDIPVFTTENGAASLVLKQIPYTKEAFVLIQASNAWEAFLRECVSFCRMAGAERVFASGYPALERYPLHTVVSVFKAEMKTLPGTDARLVAATASEIESWRGIYNNKMLHVPGAAYLSETDALALAEKGSAFFVQREEELLGIGVAGRQRIEAVASIKPGAGRDLVLALAHSLDGDWVELDVAVSNVKAVSLYKALGFFQAYEKTRWYKIV